MDRGAEGERPATVAPPVFLPFIILVADVNRPLYCF